MPAKMLSCAPRSNACLETETSEPWLTPTSMRPISWMPAAGGGEGGEGYCGGSGGDGGCGGGDGGGSEGGLGGVDGGVGG